MDETDRGLSDRRTEYPPVLRPLDLVELLGVPNERAARGFLTRHGIPCLRDGKRILIVFDVLMERLRELSNLEDAAPRRRGRRGQSVRAIAARLRD